ncbi:hypothetical protein D3M61_03785 [Aliarcobacter butzleri]|uniref:hypothetical protein n=1 Tax=Aliarcobacter butzleri TaxID=28197 RepID=UPI00102DEE9F|nr:hypothetical protein [Aliarcobacter butzleri]RZV15090.1 hypothetical protein D3M61_03785 [Aliarcobacter butzleri]
MEDYGLLVIALGVCLLVLQFYIDYEKASLDKYIKIIKDYQEKKNNGTITFIEKFDLKFRSFFITKILYKIGTIMISIGIFSIIMFLN